MAEETSNKDSSGKPKRKRISFDIDSELHRDIKRAALDDDITMIEWIADAVRIKLEKRSKKT